MNENIAADYADELSETIQAIADTLDHDGIDDGTLESYFGIEDWDDSSLYEALADWPLDVVRRVGAPFSVLLSFGGPNAWIEATLDSDGERQYGAELHVAWGGDTSVRRGAHIDRVADYYIEATNY